MKRAQALLAMSLVARRASSWAHDLLTAADSDDDLPAEAVERFKQSIKDALAVLDREAR